MTSTQQSATDWVLPDLAYDKHARKEHEKVLAIITQNSRLIWSTALDALKFPRIVSRRLLSARDRDCGFRERHWARPIGGALTHVGPAHFAGAVYDVSDWRGDEARPVPFVFSAHCANQLRLRIRQQSKRIGIETNMGPVLLGVARDTLAQSEPFVGRLNAHAENLNSLRNISFRLVDKGRHLGPAPGSPAAAVKENYGRRCCGENSGKFGHDPINIAQRRAGKNVADL